MPATGLLSFQLNYWWETPADYAVITEHWELLSEKPAQSVVLFFLLSTIWLHHQECVFSLVFCSPYIFKQKGLFNKKSWKPNWTRLDRCVLKVYRHFWVYGARLEGYSLISTTLFNLEKCAKMSGSEDDGYQPWANPAEPFQASGNCGSIDSIWGKQEVFPSALRMHKPVNAKLDQVLSVNVGNTVYFQVQASLFSAVAIVCLLSIKCVFSSWLIPRDSTCRLLSCTLGLSD